MIAKAMPLTSEEQDMLASHVGTVRNHHRAHAALEDGRYALVDKCADKVAHDVRPSTTARTFEPVNAGYAVLGFACTVLSPQGMSDGGWRETLAPVACSLTVPRGFLLVMRRVAMGHWWQRSRISFVVVLRIIVAMIAVVTAMLDGHGTRNRASLARLNLGLEALAAGLRRETWLLQAPVSLRCKGASGRLWSPPPSGLGGDRTKESLDGGRRRLDRLRGVVRIDDGIDDGAAARRTGSKAGSR